MCRALFVQILFLCGFFVFSTELHAAQNRCSGNLKSTSRKVTCELPLEKCRRGHVVWQPVCRDSCISKAAPRFEHCKTLQSERSSKCTPQMSSRNPAVICGKAARTAQQTCANEFQASQKECNQISKKGAESCRTRFSTKRQTCISQQEKDNESCKDRYNKAIDACNASRKRQHQQRLRRCRKPFVKCRKKCSKASQRWPCIKRCFEVQHKCASMKQDREIRCPLRAARQIQACDLNAGKRLLRCVRAVEHQLYSCAQKLSQKRAACLVGGGKGYASCMKKLDTERLTCWLKEVKLRFFCLGGTVEDCRAKADDGRRSCLKRCPRCKITK